MQIRLPQDQETPIRTSKGLFSYRYVSARASESRQFGELGQDYLTFTEGYRSFSFVICDGVSLSFFGNVAAKFIGDALLRGLTSDILQNTFDEVLLQKTLATFLTELTTEATKLIQTYPIPTDTPELVKNVLEEKRTLGSETTFICGRVDLQSDVLPDGRLLLGWLGDSRLRLWDRQKEQSHRLGNRFFTNERWSTQRGIISENPHIKCFTLQDITHLQVYTDGLHILDELKHIPDDAELLSSIQTASALPTSDDLTLLDLSWKREESSCGNHCDG